MIEELKSFKSLERLEALDKHLPRNVMTELSHEHSYNTVVNRPTWTFIVENLQ